MKASRVIQRNRCQNYCTVNVVCPQYKAFLSDTPQESSQPKQYEGML
jgi:hypothetical protein